jgi:uncharacterized protein
MSDEAEQRAGREEGGVFDVKLLEVLACPVTKLPLRYDREAQELISERAGLAYPIRDGVAVLAPGEARRIG